MNKNLFWVIITLIIIAVSIVIYFMNYADKKTNDVAENAAKRVQEYTGAILKTNMGNIELKFFQDKTPLTVVNFTELASIGFYDKTKFHRVIKGFMIQGGDPLSKDDSKKQEWGTGGPGYNFNDEIGKDNKNLVGTISMANAGPNTNGSQFFINVADNDFLDTKHTVFGKVVSGMDVVNAITGVATDGSDRPVEDIIIQSVILK